MEDGADRKLAHLLRNRFRPETRLGGELTHREDAALTDKRQFRVSVTLCLCGEFRLLAFSGFGGVFLSLKIIATTTAFFDFVELFSH